MMKRNIMIKELVHYSTPWSLVKSEEASSSKVPIGDNNEPQKKKLRCCEPDLKITVGRSSSKMSDNE